MDWADAAAVELDRLRGLQHEHKRRNTILLLVDARLAGRSEETVWGLPGTCARSTWHEKWKHDAAMLAALEAVERTARRWLDTRALRALADAAERLALASPAAAEQLIEVGTRGRLRYVEDGGVTSFEQANGPDMVRAALGVLDRAGVETAPKAQQQHGLAPELEKLIERVYGPGWQDDDQ